MKDPRTINIADYDYELPSERIAQYPLKERDSSKLLVYESGRISSREFRNIRAHLPETATLIFNNTRVVPARLYFTNRNGGKIEIFCLSPEGDEEINTAMNRRKKAAWNCLVGGAKKWKEDFLELKTKEGTLVRVTKMQRSGAEFLIEFSWEPGELTFSELLQEAGTTPLPPYMKRKAEQADKNRYQTVYAKLDGSVAAPTAGLHFTKEVLEDLTEKNIKRAEVTLHVSAGTFKPVQTDKMEDHEMHSEWFSVSRKNLELLIEHTQNIIPVGTTSMRTLESLYWAGVRIAQAKEPDDGFFKIEQWEGADEAAQLSGSESLTALKEYLIKHDLEHVTGKTELIIAPGIPIKICRGLITNFHQPKSTLLLLVAALIGSDYKKAYDYALKNDFRFLSYGDSCLFLP